MVKDTEQDCVLAPNESATHSIEFRVPSRISFTGELKINSVDKCIKYQIDDHNDDVTVEQEGTTVKQDVVLQGTVPKFNRNFSICVCNDTNNLDHLRTVVYSSGRDEEPSPDTEIARDGGTNDPRVVLELSPEVQIDN